MKQILLGNKGKYTIVDDADYDNLIKYKWYASERKTLKGVTVYAKHSFIKYNCDMGRMLLGLKKGDKRQVDHINGNKLDNRRENLRICTHAENQRNKKKLSQSKVSKYKGVGKRRNRWISEIDWNDKRIYLGIFDTEIDAAKAYNEAAKKYHGDFASLNLLEQGLEELRDKK